MSLEDMFALIARMPPGQFLRIGMEPCGPNDGSGDDPEMMLCASVYAEAPEDGWMDGHPADRAVDRVLCCVNAASHTVLAHLMMGMIKKKLVFPISAGGLR